GQAYVLQRFVGGGGFGDAVGDGFHGLSLCEWRCCAAYEAKTLKGGASARTAQDAQCLPIAAWIGRHWAKCFYTQYQFIVKWVDMKLPMVPPDPQHLLRQNKGKVLSKVFPHVTPLPAGRYLHWDELRHRQP